MITGKHRIRQDELIDCLSEALTLLVKLNVVKFDEINELIEDKKLRALEAYLKYIRLNTNYSTSRD